MVPLFKTLVRPVLEYGNVVWSPYLQKNIQLIENVQRKFTKRMVGFSEIEYEERLKLLRLPSLEFRRLRGDMIETYKIVHGIYDSRTTSTLFTFKDDPRTRGHSLQISKVHTNTTRFLKFFTNRVINYWNYLPENIVKAGTVNAFKNALDLHWKEKVYAINLNS